MNGRCDAEIGSVKRGWRVCNRKAIGRVEVTGAYILTHECCERHVNKLKGVSLLHTERRFIPNSHSAVSETGTRGATPENKPLAPEDGERREPRREII